MATFDAASAETAPHSYLIGALILVGIFLRLWQYGVHSSLWLDEAALARNIVERSLSQLFAPLDYGQVAPLGFLLLQKGVVALAGASELALRLVPLGCGIASLFLFATLARAVLPSAAAPYAVGLFAVGQPFIYFSSQVKQYSSDVALGLTALLIVLDVATRPVSRIRIVLFAVVGVVVPWLSQPAMLVLVGAGLGLMVADVLARRRARLRAVVPLLLMWTIGAAAAGAYARSQLDAQTASYMAWFWRIGFPPVEPWPLAQWLWRTANSVFSAFPPELIRTNGGLAYVWPQAYVAAAAIGLGWFLRGRRDVGLILLGPLVCALAASMLRLYPLAGRLVVFLIPIVLLFAAAGLHVVWVWAAQQSRVLAIAVALGCLAIPISAAVVTRPPYVIQPIRPVLEEVQARWMPGDVAYVDYAAGQAFLFYAPQLGFEPTDYVVGECSQTDRRAYLRQVDAFRGRRRVWIIGTHMSVVERSIVVGYLERIGYRRASIFEPPVGAPLGLAAYARLYDLSDPDRLATTTAATHAFEDVPVEGAVAEWGCFGPVLPGR